MVTEEQMKKDWEDRDKIHAMLDHIQSPEFEECVDKLERATNDFMYRQDLDALQGCPRIEFREAKPNILLVTDGIRGQRGYDSVTMISGYTYIIQCKFLGDPSNYTNEMMKEISKMDEFWDITVLVNWDHVVDRCDIILDQIKLLKERRSAMAEWICDSIEQNRHNKR
jgi:hypothetical protein